MRGLLAQGLRVQVLDESMSGLADICSPLLGLHCGSVLDSYLISSLVKESDVLIHLAAFSSLNRCKEDPIHSRRVNVEGTKLIGDIVNRFRKLVIFTSSAAVYGSNPPPHSENMDVNPLSLYAEQKVEAEEHLIESGSSLILRLFNVYGPSCPGNNSNEGVISKFLKGALENTPVSVSGDGGQLRDFVYIDEVVRALILGSRFAGTSSVFNVGTGVNSSVNELVRLISRVTGRNVETRGCQGKGDEVRISLAETTKASNVLGFTSTVPLVDGLARTYRALQ